MIREINPSTEQKYSSLKLYYSKGKKDYVKSKTKFSSTKHDGDGKFGYWDCCSFSCDKCCPYANKSKLKRNLIHEIQFQLD